MSLFGAIAMGVGSLVGGKMSADAATDAGDAMADATKYAADLTNKQYETTRGDLAPYRDVGPGALNYLTGLVTPRASDADLAKWGRQVGNVKGKIQDTNALIKKRTDRLKKLGKDASYTETVTTTGNPNNPYRQPGMSAMSNPDNMKNSIGAGLAGGLIGGMADGYDAATGAEGTTTTTREYTDPRLQKLYDRRDNLKERRSTLNENINAGENGMQLRDPYAFGEDAIYNMTPQRETAAYGDTPYAFEGDGIKIGNRSGYRFDAQNYLDPNAYEESPEYQYLKGKAHEATVADASARGTRYSGNVAQALQENAVGLASMDRQNWFNNQYTRAQNDRQNFDTSLAGRNAWVNNQNTRSGNARADAALGMQGYTSYNALRNNNDAWNYGLALDSYGRAMGERQDTVNNLFNLTGIGQNAATMTGNFGANAATNAGNMAVAGGRAQSEAIQGASSAWGTAFNDVAGIYGAYNRGWFDPRPAGA